MHSFSIKNYSEKVNQYPAGVADVDVNRLVIVQEKDEELIKNKKLLKSFPYKDIKIDVF